MERDSEHYSGYTDPFKPFAHAIQDAGVEPAEGSSSLKMRRGVGAGPSSQDLSKRSWDLIQCTRCSRRTRNILALPLPAGLRSGIPLARLSWMAIVAACVALAVAITK